ncbi:MAG: hypothetical protein MJE63_03390 [Proteobacteria bacterium]|nr:hypothetical protein [Pseudomonadota bacterium]
MKNRYRIITETFVVIAILFGSFAVAATKAEASAGDLKILEISYRTIQDLEILSISPDGKWIAGLNNNRSLVIYDLWKETKVWEDTARKTQYTDKRYLSWSPSGRYLTFHENWERHLYDSDIYMLDTQLWKLTNITDDHYQGAYLKAVNDEWAIDCCTGWGRDEQHVYFLRRSKESSTSLFRVCLKSKMQELIIPSITQREGTTSGIFLNDKTREIYFSVELGSGKKTNKGIWSLDLENKELVQRINDHKLRDTAVLTSFSSISQRGIYVYPQLLVRLPPDKNLDLFFLWEPNSNKTSPIISRTLNSTETNPKNRGYKVVNAILSPNGNKLAMVCLTGNRMFHVIIKDLEDNSEKIILKRKDELAGIGLSPGRSGLWLTKDNTLIISTFPMSFPGSRFYRVKLGT